MINLNYESTGSNILNEFSSSINHTLFETNNSGSYTISMNNYSEGPAKYFLNIYIPKNKINKSNYFNDFTEKAIIAYNYETDEDMRDYIFKKYIYKSFDKLAENTINNNKLYYFSTTYEDFKHEVIAHMIQKLDKYDISKGKAFSFFYIVCRNYLIIENNKNYDTKKMSDDIMVADDNVMFEYLNNEATEELSEFIDKFSDYMQENLYLFFPKERDRNIAEALIYMFKNRKELYSYKKKNIFVLLRERSKEPAIYITKNLKVFKTKFYELYNNYKKCGMLEQNKFFK